MVYQAEFKITSQMYTAELAEANSTEYSKLAGNVSLLVCDNWKLVSLMLLIQPTHKVNLDLIINNVTQKLLTQKYNI